MIVVRVKGLEKWQHYKHRNPPWIKLYNSIFNDYEFSTLDDCSKFHLIGIWSLASVMENALPNDAAWIASRIGAKTQINLDLFLQAGFIELFDKQSGKPLVEESEVISMACSERKQLASNALAPCKQNAPTETETETETEERGRQKRKRFVPPTLEEVSARCQEMGYGIDPDRFWNFYESQGWKVGKNPMRDWHRALAGWQSREGNKTSRKTDFVDDLTDTSWAH